MSDRYKQSQQNIEKYSLLTWSLSSSNKISVFSGAILICNNLTSGFMVIPCLKGDKKEIANNNESVLSLKKIYMNGF